ncbi:bifunctional diaminohydroxyphosphoribosylaminopyrimidine deaminase/5-amino-6-(5-phosphoribosylamino)uracil reductase RibD [Epilithonimonas ginsengisoli]|uniref:Riboflavin biosynthesis protein RibD n=1 Tax=Epilithonimonas ginsengisoli TaxID=1245592 RepID=A0ABU4JKU8_9FLAO|nr:MULTISPECIES: bifunctional diaminohydroxyphosphoribosylaminopyrimidine deaminase/5-amino-6-(5-phosphoribosylamino)uracil reductase RibD [Chryseobacterium group]MBV6881286.1 bifunctional diaminohydroxyphosphoribosylaminopyrimidine deaminase/5-amino-6-(5-phosphoribosylamino)uracil reductase RibD [Epilithonimonas sp. FP105]MDW8550247.1 bifunctional diaminohydroxyphosphoribosylaminopyrimidine deaminase/5-amino-6-(5-phosphoribosylamino)uracil reductase RibD [Epilithonimonas ginsengisoli]OAH69336.1
MKDEIYIKRCIELAEKALGKTYPNPLVGSVIVHNNRIIGEGFHKKAGEPHAEINAINSIKVEDRHLIPESTIYVSLEPCAHFGKTPPCALKIVELGFKKVVIGAMDSHDKVNGKGKKIIIDAGIEVVSSVLENECRALNKRFFTYHEKRRPFIILKWAQSADGFMDKDFKPTQISNSLSKQLVHQMRSEEHAILVGKNTALHDNPSLTVREIEGRNPIRILIDFNLDVPKNFNIYNEEAETIIFNSIKNSEDKNLKFIKIEKENSLNKILDKLYELQIQSIIIEGGRFTLQQFIDQNLWDETVIFKNPNLNLENGTKAPNFNFKPEKTEMLRDCEVLFFTNQSLD